MDNQGNPAANAAARPWWWFWLQCVAVILAFVIGICAYYMRDEESIAKGSDGVIESLYFSVITITTVGYGDYFPNTGISMLLTSILAIFFAPGATSAINAAIGWLLSQATQRTGLNHRPRYIQIVSATILLLLLLIGSGISLISVLEGKKFHYLDVWYFNIITVMTVGYGDFSFTSPKAQIFASFYVFIASLLVSRYINFLNSSWRHWRIGPNSIEQQYYHTRTTLGLERAYEITRERRQRVMLLVENSEIKLENVANEIKNAIEQLQVWHEVCDNTRADHTKLFDLLRNEIPLMDDIIRPLQVVYKNLL
ncbi:two-pore potassium channel 2-like [Malus sylvestris]|uniref:two-pore potassium channel 2-like n=1 Tax=Malus sylvestris TaxID=3752 RepID=UPI0021AB9BBD|nr:two-pore potassium channel 2-like [Malus sylvestris]